MNVIYEYYLHNGHDISQLREIGKESRERKEKEKKKGYRLYINCRK
jgi:hypothetical protein